MIELTEDVLIDRINDMLLQASLHPDIRFLLVAAKKRIFAMTARDNTDKQWIDFQDRRLSEWMEKFYEKVEEVASLKDELRTWTERSYALSAKLAEQVVLPTDDRCKDCGCGLLFSARDIGDGYCHSCAHHRFKIAMDAIHFLRARTTENAGNSDNLYAYSSMQNWREFVRLAKEAGDTWL